MASPMRPLATISRATSTEGTAYGAALLAAVGGGAFDSVESACATAIREIDRVEPGPDAPTLLAAHDIYADLYPALSETFNAIARSTE